MGHLYYSAKSDGIPFDDRLLWHVKLVIIAKLRRQESFSFSWQSAGGRGLTCVWIHPSCDLVFDFHDDIEPVVNKLWLEALMHSANSTGGMHVVPEPPSGNT
jgi:hypothetical protein